MKTISNTSAEILGIDPSELTGYSVAEIADMIKSVQAGVQGEKLTDEQIEEAAQKIFEDASN